MHTKIRARPFGRITSIVNIAMDDLVLTINCLLWIFLWKLPSSPVGSNLNVFTQLLQKMKYSCVS